VSEFPNLVKISYNITKLLQVEDFQYGGLTLNFDLDLSKVNSQFGEDAHIHAKFCENWTLLFKKSLSLPC